ncbi:SDR family NAD(P)-dependent oxidoreductase [Streptomyces sp. NPDC056402]|uniref:SDR family NAD(P)-dependent oxidoreductase n=1 Tax=Streptomyces sp. NPDC056402 TaxID=3345810 RepID=UPI0035DA68FA
MRDDVVLVTGGTGVVGVGVVRRLVRSGHRVLLGYWSNGACVQRLCDELGPDLSTVRVDLGLPDAPDRLFAELDSRGVGVRSLVHSAALVDHTLPEDLTAEHFARVMAVNVTSGFLLVRGLAAREEFRSAVLLSSVAAEFTGMGSAAYEASKGAVDSLTRALAAQYAPRVRVNAVAPGVVRSHRTESDPEFSSTALSARVPGGRLAEPDDVAAAAEFLIGDQAGYMTGQVLRVDGGLSLKLL